MTNIILEILEQQTIQRRNIEILTMIEPTLKSFEGKKITKRLTTILENIYPNYKFYLQKSFSNILLYIWNDEITYSNRLNLNLARLNNPNLDLCKFDNPIFEFAYFEFNNQRFYLYKSRCEALQVYVDDKSILENLEKEYQDLKIAIEIFKSKIPKEYPISQHFKL